MVRGKVTLRTRPLLALEILELLILLFFPEKNFLLQVEIVFLIYYDQAQACGCFGLARVGGSGVEEDWVDEKGDRVSTWRMCPPIASALSSQLPL